MMYRLAATTAATVAFTSFAALAAPVTVNFTLAERTLAGTSGFGSLDIEETLLAPGGGTSDIGDISNFSATFSGLTAPAPSPLVFGQSDLTAIDIQVGAGGAFTAFQFETGVVDEFSVSFSDLAFIASPGDEDFGTEPVKVTLEGPQTRIYRIFADNPVATPEPGALGLLALGAVALPLLRRRRARRA